MMSHGLTNDPSPAPAYRTITASKMRRCVHESASDCFVAVRETLLARHEAARPCLRATLMPVGKHAKTLEQVLSGRSDANIRFEDLRSLVLALGFTERTRGSHHMFGKVGIDEQINLQREGAKAKPYQVKQVRAVIVRYNLRES